MKFQCLFLIAISISFVQATFENDEYSRSCGVKKAGETCVTANLDSNAECGDKEVSNTLLILHSVGMLSHQ